MLTEENSFTAGMRFDCRCQFRDFGAIYGIIYDIFSIYTYGWSILDHGMIHLGTRSDNI